jgi:hypothetical protein
LPEVICELRPGQKAERASERRDCEASKAEGTGAGKLKQAEGEDALKPPKAAAGKCLNLDGQDERILRIRKCPDKELGCLAKDIQDRGLPQ